MNTATTTKEAHDLKIELAQFYGSEQLHRLGIFSRTVLTDGAHYLAQKAGAFWLMDAIDSHLQEEGVSDLSEFTKARLTVNDNHEAELTLDDGNGLIWRTQKIPYTDFPMPSIDLFAIYNGTAWTLMLPSEY
jgi:hypothetical protein